MDTTIRPTRSSTANEPMTIGPWLFEEDDARRRDRLREEEREAMPQVLTDRQRSPYPGRRSTAK